MKLKLHVSKVKTFLYWIEEREAIRLARVEGAKPPWTHDEILATFRFCNVRRRDDRVSQWIINRVLQPYANHPNLWIMAALARFVNWPPTLNALMELGYWPTQSDPDWRGIGEALDARVAEGEQTWTGAYMIRAESNPYAEWYDWGKGRYITEVVIGGLWEDQERVLPWITHGVEHAWTAIHGHYGFGSFMTGQVVADLTYTPLLSDAPDLYTWAPLGPGSKRGLNRLLGRGLKEGLKQDDAVNLMCELRDTILAKLGSVYSDLTLHDVQNCLCEVDKYLRVYNGEGRPRALYRSHA